jgi:hypothetical protein
MRMKTYLRVEFIDSLNSFLNTSGLYCFAYPHALLNENVVYMIRHAGFTSEFDGCIGKPLDDKIVEYEGVEIAVRQYLDNEKAVRRREFRAAKYSCVSSIFLGEIPTCNKVSSRK